MEASKHRSIELFYCHYKHVLTWDFFGSDSALSKKSQTSGIQL